MTIRDRVRELRRVRGRDLAPNPKNWRTHPPEQLDALRGVLAEVGFAGAALAYELPDGSLRLIDGHARAETAPDAEIPVLVLDVTEAEADVLLATFDPLGAMAGADASKLDALLRDVRTSNDAIAGMLQGLAEEAGCEWGQTETAVAGGGGDEFEASPEPDGPTRTADGDLWVIGGRHRLLVGDCTDPTGVARLLAGASPFLMVTDPPYGVDYDPDWRNEAADAGHLSYAARRTGQVANDGRADWTAAYRLFPGAVAYVWHAGRHAGTVAAGLAEAGLAVRSQIVWRKPTFAISRGHYHWQHEPCWYAARDGESARWCGDRTQSTVWDISNRVNDEDRNDHGTQKPLECMARPIRNHGGEGDLVYDPFLGSGTTLVAAHRLGRACYGCELEPKYADVILNRAEAEGLAVEKAG
ncbi:MAG TPA: DNA methyltransferase [Urbifossiella sp.]|nr:DNA methyltransferase [Urbifossiella sp.]